MEELLEKIPPEKCWAITAKTLSRLSVLRGSKIMPSTLGKVNGVISPVWGWEKWQEILNKVYTERSRRLHLSVNEKFNVPVEDAIGAAKLEMIVLRLFMGPEYRDELVETTPEKTVIKITKCPWDERFKEFDVDPTLRGACEVHQEAWHEEAFKAINPKISGKLVKSMSKGDPYCEVVIEFKEE